MKVGLWILPLLLTGCMFSERSFRYDPLTRVEVDPIAQADGPAPTTRQWLANASPQLEMLLPDHEYGALITEGLTSEDGQPTDVVTYYDIPTDRLESVFANFHGLSYSAQATMPHGPPKEAPPWDGFDDVWIPVADGLELAGRLGFARDLLGRPIEADCIVILPGIRGNNNILRVRDLAHALHVNGFHVLTLELRGTGQSDVRYPEFDYTWGVWETDDLLAVADWLQAKDAVQRTGLLGYSWGGNHAMMAAWADGRTDNDDVPENLRAIITPPAPARRRYEAGIIAFSPMARPEVLMDKLATDRSFLINPALAGLQSTFRGRMIEKGYPHPTGDVRELIRRVDLGYDDPMADILAHTRLLPYNGLAPHDRFSDIRVPVLLVQAADDPIGPAQDMADLMATVDNPNVAAIMLPTGGHIGFAPYASDWYYNLILNFFDPVVGAAPVVPAEAIDPE